MPVSFRVPTLNIHENVLKGKATDVPTVENTRAISVSPN
jgi:hypothetical protein